jgi:D-serine deaminase-like pyridoxal phosphate-dependent protein
LPQGIETPALVVDLDVVERNVHAMQRDLAARGVGLRPHAKTHKSVRLAQLQLDAGAIGITVGTLGEAEVLRAGGISRLFVAYPVWAGGSKAARLRDLHDATDLLVGMDSPEGAQALGDAVRGAAHPLRVLVEIDSGHRRTGVRPERAAEVAGAARAAGLVPVGVFTHGGHAYSGPGAVDPAAADEIAALLGAAERLRAGGTDVEIVSAGSTPTARKSARPGITEERPGTYIFNDRQQIALGAATAEAVGLVVAATVVSVAAADRFVLDAGAKTLANDQAEYLAGYGFLPSHPRSVIRRVSDYHGVVELGPGDSLPSVGDVVSVVPNHVCPVVNLADVLVVTRSGRLIDRWPVDARGRTN